MVPYPVKVVEYFGEKDGRQPFLDDLNVENPLVSRSPLWTIARLVSCTSCDEDNTPGLASRLDDYDRRRTNHARWTVHDTPSSPSRPCRGLRES